MKKIIYIVFILIVMLHAAYSKRSKAKYYKTKDVTLLFNTQYYPALLKEIKKAKKEIIIVMFLVRFNIKEKSPVYKLTRELVKARKKGIKVTVFLDDYIYDEKKNRPVNYEFYKYLRKNNIKVIMDNTEKIYHTKLVIIDKETVITGSANWTTAAFTLNNEVSVLIKSKGLAKKLYKKMRALLK